jgi:hypothetical protein
LAFASVDHLVVGIGKSALEVRAHAAQRRAHAALKVSRQVKVDQSIGGQDLDLGVGVAGSHHQRIQAARRPDLDDLFDRLGAHVQAGIGEVLGQAGDGVRTGLGSLANVLGARGLLCRQSRRKRQKRNHDSKTHHVSTVTRLGGLLNSGTGVSERTRR